MTTQNLPDFEKPPVVEVVLAVQFEKLEKFNTPQVGLLWSKYRDKFCNVKELQPLMPVIENFTTRPKNLEMNISVPPTPRCLFVNKNGDELIQIQKDRFIRNWRKIDAEDVYPKFKELRQNFISEFKIFEDFIQEENVGELIINQCEVTYANHIFSDDCWMNHSEAFKIINIINKNNYDFLPVKEDTRIFERYIIPDDDENPLGRLNIKFEPAFVNEDKKPFYVLTLIARGNSKGNTLSDILEFFDIGHKWIVNGFTDITTPEMHKIWGRKNDGK